jgi:hypothetical protein
VPEESEFLSLSIDMTGEKAEVVSEYGIKLKIETLNAHAICKNLTKLKTMGMVLVASLLLSSIAFYNGYPLVYPDTGSYISLKDNLFRSFFYNLFVFPSSWLQSLWPVVFLQSLIVAHLLFVVLRSVFGMNSPPIFFAVTTLLCLVSNLPWFTGFIMPDIFTGVLILSLFLIVFCWPSLGLGEKIYFFILTVISITVHLSHIPIAVGLLICASLLRVTMQNRHAMIRHHVWQGWVAVCVALVLLLSNGYRHQNMLTLSPNGYCFLLARLIVDGPATLYLRDNCAERKYALCDYLNQIPATSDEFLWAAESPFCKVGWISGYRSEGIEIIKETIRHYPFLIIKNAFRNMVSQLPMINNWYGLCSYMNSSHPTHDIRKHYPGDFHAYATSKQSLNQLSLNAFNRLHSAVIRLSLPLIALMFFIFLKRRHYLPALFLITIVSAYVLSSFVTGALSVPHDRYGSRIIWLLPFFSIASLTHEIVFWRNDKGI